MKRVYERPLMSVELFMANQAVSTCTVQGGIDWTFDCMRGPTTDTANVISTHISGVEATCNVDAGYAPGILTARDYYNSNSHSPARTGAITSTWQSVNDSSGNYLQVTYTGGQGLLYTDGNASTDAQVWSNQGTYVKHSNQSGGIHHMVAPVIDTTTISASM